MRRRGLLVFVVIVALLTLAAPEASAEFFTDLYLGGAFTSDDDLDAQFGTTLQLLEDVEFDDALVLGARVGYWFPRPLYDTLGIGLALDVSYFEPDIDAQTVFGSQVIGNFVSVGDFVVFPIDVSVIVVGFDLMLRWGVLPSYDFPNGRLHPYFSIGPAVFFSEAEDTTNFTPGGQSDSDTSVGFKMGAGLTYLITRNVGIFGEWRFTYFSPEWKFNDLGESGRLETDIDTFYMLVGVAFRF
jgi:outer membrane immunogenic protein